MSHGVVLVGLGAIGLGYDLGFPPPEHIRTHARAFQRHSAFSLLAGVDTDPERRRTFSELYGAPAYESIVAALAVHQPAVAVIATPTVAHASSVRAVLECCRPKMLLCEKPLATDTAEAEEMIAACRSRGVALYVNYMRRSDPGAIAVRDMIHDGRIRTPIKAVVWYSKGLLHNGSHLVDLLRYWLGPVQTARINNSGRRWQGRDPEPDFTLVQEQCVSTFLAANEECFSHYTVELVAPNGRLRYEQEGGRVEWQDVVEDPDFPGYRVLDRRPQVLPADMLRAQLNVVAELASALEGQSPNLCSGAEALETLRDVQRVFALIEGKPWSV